MGAPPPDAFTKRYTFSECVPRILSEAKAMAAEYTEYAREWPEFAARCDLQTVKPTANWQLPPASCYLS